MTTVTDQATQDFAHLITGFMQQMFPHLDRHGLDHRMLASALVGASTRLATQWVIDRCKAPMEDLLRNNLAVFKAMIQYSQTLSTCKDV